MRMSTSWRCDDGPACLVTVRYPDLARTAAGNGRARRAVGSVSGALEPFLTRHARGHVGNGTEPRRRDRRPALHADAVLAIRDAAQRDLQALRPLAQA